MTFEDIFPGLSRTKVIFWDFPGPEIFRTPENKDNSQDKLGATPLLLVFHLNY